MKKFLYFFVGAACFAGTFSVPHALEYYVQGDENLSIEKTMKMRDPASVGLQACELCISTGMDIVAVQNLKGDRLICFVGWPVKFEDWSFAAQCSGEEFGEVWLLTNDELGKHLMIESCGGEKTPHKLGAVTLWKSLQRRRYEFGKDGIILRKFFGCDDAGADVFVSATIAYNDLKRVEIGIGRDGDDLDVNIGTLLRRVAIKGC